VLGISAVLFRADALTATTNTAFWCVASSSPPPRPRPGYLTVSEMFPQEVRGQAISYSSPSRSISAPWWRWSGGSTPRMSLEELAPPLTEYDDSGKEITHLPV
jgi:hypothetical protein